MNLSLHPSAQIDAGLLCGYNVVIEENVRIGVNCHLGHGVIIRAGTQIGDRVESTTSRSSASLRCDRHGAQ